MFKNLWTRFKDWLFKKPVVIVVTKEEFERVHDLCDHCIEELRKKTPKA